MTSEIDDLTAMIDADPDDAWLFYERGCARYEAREWKLALEDFDRSIALDDREPEFRQIRGVVYEILGHVGEAREDFDHAIALDPFDAEGYEMRGWFRKANHQYKDALDDYTTAIGFDPTNASYRSDRGLVLLQLGDFGRALEDFDDAISLDPEEASFHYHRALALPYHNHSEDVRPEDALPDLEEAIRLNPAAVWYRSDRGYIRFTLGRWADAAEDFACQDIKYRYRFCPDLGSEIAIWHHLARLFQGEEAAGLAFVKQYLAWYSTLFDAGAKPIPPSKRKAWPVPLARFLAGEIDERELLETATLGEWDPGLVSIDVEEMEKRIMEHHFVLGELLLHQGRRDEALPHLKEACGLPAANPMRWAAARQIAGI